VLSYSAGSAPEVVLNTTKLFLSVRPVARHSFDNIELFSDGLTTTTTYAYKDANELTSKTGKPGTAT